jgi:hypothetical protein
LRGRGAHGYVERWLVNPGLLGLSLVPPAPLVGVGVGVRGPGGGGLGTLLGPEETNPWVGFLGPAGRGALCVFCARGGLFFENCIVDASIFFALVFLSFSACFVCVVEVVEGAWWMPWHRDPMKDVGVCDIPRGVGNQAVIRGFPNGVTWHLLWGVAAG